jgi:hypothetical protein
MEREPGQSPGRGKRVTVGMIGKTLLSQRSRYPRVTGSQKVCPRWIATSYCLRQSACNAEIPQYRQD